MAIDHRPATELAAVSQASQIAIQNIRRMILGRQLLPGQQLRQEELAISLGISRSPIREALQVLLADGFVSHSVNRGYFVTRLDADVLDQMYLMRRLLETEIYQRLAWPDSKQIEQLQAVNETLQAAADRDSVEQMVKLNRQFHFAIFEGSALSYLVEEVNRLWLISEPYRAIYLTEEGPRQRVVDEHERIITALQEHDREALISLADRHREAARKRVVSLLAPPVAWPVVAG